MYLFQLYQHQLLNRPFQYIERERIECFELAVKFINNYFMNSIDNIRSCQTEQIVVSLEISRMFFELLAPKINFFQFVLLNHGAHCTINDHYALFKRFIQMIKNIFSIEQPKLIMKQHGKLDVLFSKPWFLFLQEFEIATILCVYFSELFEIKIK